MPALLRERDASCNGWSVRQLDRQIATTLRTNATVPRQIRHVAAARTAEPNVLPEQAIRDPKPFLEF